MTHPQSYEQVTVATSALRTEAGEWDTQSATTALSPWLRGQRSRRGNRYVVRQLGDRQAVDETAVVGELVDFPAFTG